VEPGHVAKYHCLTATSVKGFLTGADTIRSLDEEYRCFNPNGLKRRDYFYDWDYGHRYILNVREGEKYTRHYKGMGERREFYIPNTNGKDPELVNKRYRLRGNGLWTYELEMTARGLAAAHSHRNVAATPGGLSPAAAGEPAELVYKINSANVATSMELLPSFRRATEEDRVAITVSTDNGVRWREIPLEVTIGQSSSKLTLVEEVNGAYEILIKVSMRAAKSPADVTLRSLAIHTITALNSKTQPRLHVGKNTVYVGAGEQTDSIVFWPELQNDKYKSMVVEEKNVKSAKQHPGYMGVLHPAKANEDAYVVYRIDAPRDIVKLTYGGRFYNRAPKSHIDMLHSFDGGKSWQKSWSLTDTAMPWDVIHYETVAVPASAKSVLVKYLMNTPEPKVSGCSIYAVRMEANCKPAEAAAKPVAVTFAWNEVQKDRSLVKRSHTEVVEKWPATYTINVGGEDHPVMESLAVSVADGSTKAGYSDGKDVGGEKWVGRWETVGKNMAVGKPYTLSHPSKTNWDAGDPDGKKLTDGVAGPTYAGGTSYATGAIWDGKTNPAITVDLGQSQSCASFGMNFHGYPWHDAMKGQIKDTIEVLVSDDGKEFRPVGRLKTNQFWKEIPVNYVWTDEETMAGGTFRVIPERPVTARFVQYRVKSDRNFCATELEVLDSIRYEPFDLRVALPQK
jgi:hypothetical protein